MDSTNNADEEPNNMLGNMYLISNRAETLSDIVVLLEGRYNDPDNIIDEKCVELLTNLQYIKENTTSLRHVLEQLKEQTDVMTARLETIRDVGKHIDYVKSHLPQGLTDSISKNKDYIPNKNGIGDMNAQNMVSPIPPSWSLLESPAPNLIAKVPDNRNEFVSKTTTVRTIAYVTETEMNNVPKYMRGRLNAATVNKLIDAFNATLQKKYETIRKPKKAIKPKELDYYCDWKRDENTEPKGTFFITVQDVNTFGGMKMDKTNFNIVTVLRHVKRIRETRHMNGQIHFIVL